MREQFEKLPEIESSLGEHIWFGSDGLYHSALVNFQGLVGWLNGAWYAYQEQQKKIDEKDYDLTEVGMIINNDGLMYEAMIERIKELLK